MATIAERISEGLEIRGLKQADLVRMTGIGKSSISTYLTGEYEPKQKNIYKIAKALNVSEAWLMGLDVPMERTISSLDITNDKPTSIPVLGRISAGLPLLAAEHLEGFEFAPSTFLKNGFDYFYLKVKGDSMNQKFNDGDLVLVQKQDELENGDIGVVLVNGDDATIKRYKNENGLVVLEPMSTNPIHSVQIYNPKDISIRIVGKAIISVSNL